MYTEKTDYYNHRVHWAFRNDEVKTPLGKLGSAMGRPLPEDFELSLLATGKRFTRTVDGSKTSFTTAISSSLAILSCGLSERRKQDPVYTFRGFDKEQKKR